MISEKRAYINVDQGDHDDNFVWLLNPLFIQQSESQPANAGDRIKPGVERSGTPGV